MALPVHLLALLVSSPVKGFEQGSLVLTRNPNSVVLYFNNQIYLSRVSLSHFGLDSDLDFPSRRREFDSVCEQV